MELTETFADVAALIPKYSWEIMDEEQRDDLIAKVVLPRYMATTVDGVQLGPKAWAEMVGASSGAIQKRVERLKTSQIQNDEETTRAVSPSRVRHARSALAEATPDQIGEIVDSLPEEQKAEIVKASLSHRLPKASSSNRSERGDMRFIEAEGIFGTIKSKVRRLFEIRREANFDDEHKDLFLDSAKTLRNDLDFLILAAEGESSIDWDAELAKMS